MSKWFYVILEVEIEITVMVKSLVQLTVIYITVSSWSMKNEIILGEVLLNGIFVQTNQRKFQIYLFLFTTSARCKYFFISRFCTTATIIIHIIVVIYTATFLLLYIWLNIYLFSLYPSFFLSSFILFTLAEQADFLISTK